MSNNIDVFAAPSVEAVARVAAVGLEADAENWGTPDVPSWHIASPDWVVHVRGTTTRVNVT